MEENESELLRDTDSWFHSLLDQNAGVSVMSYGLPSVASLYFV